MSVIKFEDFQKLDLKVGRVISAERVQRARKLLLLKVDLGGEIRTLVAGLAEHYTPEQLLNKQVIVVANLEPKVVMGLKSEGMLLAAVTADKPVLIVPEEEVPPGTKVS
ncbi:MAG: methionine--tRNA ligase subunit beta [Thermofilaceae archaeon]|nr:methionine--tRNA ligase subunit beta [Thermofilaceae archaeon]MCX8180165.1 methionine--tRNA ligase subunit beta [Thermofilaceae archaeon]MDW8004179.1 methionine--tRNA ligase subunit beta [Thermofilaceae archaeon]